MKKLVLAIAVSAATSQASAYMNAFIIDAGLDTPFEPPFADPGHIQLTDFSASRFNPTQDVNTFSINLANVGTGNPGDFSYSADWTYYASAGHILVQNVVCTDLDTASSFCSSDVMGGFQSNGLKQIDVFDSVSQLPIAGPTTQAFDMRWTSITGSGLFDWKLSFGTQLAAPVPAAAWLFGSAIIGLVGIKRKK